MNKETVSSDKAPKAIGPYAQAIKVGDLVYTAGQIPIDPQTGNLVSGGIAEQTQAARLEFSPRDPVEAAGVVPRIGDHFEVGASGAGAESRTCR